MLKIFFRWFERPLCDLELYSRHLLRGIRKCPLRAIKLWHPLSKLRQTGSLQRETTQESRPEAPVNRQNLENLGSKTELRSKNGYQNSHHSPELPERDEAPSQMSNGSADSMTSLTSTATINSSARGWSSSFSSNFQRSNTQAKSTSFKTDFFLIFRRIIFFDRIIQF